MTSVDSVQSGWFWTSGGTPWRALLAWPSSSQQTVCRRAATLDWTTSLGTRAFLREGMSKAWSITLSLRFDQTGHPTVSAHWTLKYFIFKPSSTEELEQRWNLIFFNTELLDCFFISFHTEVTGCIILCSVSLFIKKMDNEGQTVIILTPAVKVWKYCFADSIGPLRWSHTPTWLKLVWLLTPSCSNGFTIPEVPAAQGTFKSNRTSLVFYGFNTCLQHKEDDSLCTGRFWVVLILWCKRPV